MNDQNAENNDVIMTLTMMMSMMVMETITEITKIASDI